MPYAALSNYYIGPLLRLHGYRLGVTAKGQQGQRWLPGAQFSLFGRPSFQCLLPLRVDPE